MANNFSIETAWEASEQGAPEERATFAELGILVNDTWLTEAHDAFSQSVRQKVHLSPYRLAEWFAWNWWRLRWEPYRKSFEWRESHSISSIGGGFVWPNIAFSPDGERVRVETQPTDEIASEPIRYIRRRTDEISAITFENGIDDFINRVCAKLHAARVAESNLKKLWNDVLEERASPDSSEYRKIEALLGYDPDGAGVGLVERIVEDGKVLGVSGVEELAARKAHEEPPTKDQVLEWAGSANMRRDPRNAIKLIDQSESSLPKNVEAWRRGKAAARALRRQIGIVESASISTSKLCEMVGSSSTQIKDDGHSPFTFRWDETVASGRIALRARRQTSQRFDLARMIGDIVTNTKRERFVPILDSETYKQKLQKAFAAEFLSPFNEIDRMLNDDFDDERVEAVASHFEVSPLAIKASLANHHKIGRHEVYRSDS